MNQVELLNVAIDNVSMQELLASLNQGVVFTPNVDHLVKLQSDREFFEAYMAADYRTCDSKIIYYALKLVRRPIVEKISGSDLFPAFYQYHKHNEDVKIFLLGAKEGVAAEAQRRINAKVGRDIVIGVHSPSFGFERNEEECQQIIEMINQSGATVLAIGAGAPKQEKFIHKYKNQFKHIKIFMAIGATIDFEAGNVSRAPKWISEMGLEWLYRLVSEPRRLWRRYLLEGPTFFWFLLMQAMKLYVNPFDSTESDRSKYKTIIKGA
ncbi:WecB/TagA/CpsF family glycosyltransferase [Thermocoleostomius sinensis]|uniref:WecB/TagA/CpsF family glycosyltransferase n=1 Tax=Thermocoleostomius sinensis A174 TaxID=2016057 RepID=A0A9E9C5Z1_9CYAN|nr:WecB/TagA/CpsF family glycosyltransferase [Thermocoleostomius sinensis]WAL61696.1 WecB/TagA/CpsF family glycosyltransferase [Thermocoleostomius sinensis A174]